MLLAIEVLKELREAEGEAEKFKKEAELKAKEMLKASDSKAQEEFDRIIGNAQVQAQAIIKGKEDEANAKANIILQEGNKELEKMKVIPEEKIEKAVNLIIERIVNPNGNS